MSNLLAGNKLSFWMQDHGSIEPILVTRQHTREHLMRG